MFFNSKALRPITLVKENLSLRAGDTFTIEEQDRVINLANQDAIDILSIDGNYTSKGDRVVFYCEYMAKIGGIETAIYNLSRQFKDRNITFVFGKANIEQVIRVAENRPVIFDDGKMTIEADVLIIEGYKSYDYIKNRIKARKIYQRCHADWETLNGIVKKNDIAFYKDMNVLSVSEVARKGLEPIKSQVVPVIPTGQVNSDFRLFLTLSRLSGEKGGKYIVKMARRFVEAGKSFLWIVSGTPTPELAQQMKRLPFVIIEPSIKNEGLIKKVDYLVQMSDSESHCFSVHTALENGCPCLVSDIKPFMQVIKDGQNGYVIDRNLYNLDIEKIFCNVPRFEPKNEPIPKEWDKVLKGEL